MPQVCGVLRESGLDLRPGARSDCAQDGTLHVVVLPVTSRAPRAADILGKYRRAGLEGARRHASDCGLVLCDTTSHTMLLLRDELGTIPLYYGAKRGQLAFGTRVVDVARANTLFQLVPNRSALAALLVDGDAAAPDQTYFADIQSVAPGHGLLWRRGHGSTLPPVASSVTVAQLTFDQAAQQWAEHFRSAVQTRMSSPARTAVMVSGGLDSAAIICVARTYGDVIGITYGPRDAGTADESRYIDLLVEAGVRVERVPFYPTMDWVALEESVRAGETPAFDLVPLTLQRALDAARAAGADELLLGTWGDQLLAPFPPPQHGAIAPWRMLELFRLARAYHSDMRDVPLAYIRRLLWRQSLRMRAPAWLLEARRRRRRRRSVFDVLAAEFAPAELQPRADLRAALHAGVQTAAQTEALAGTAKWGHAHGMSVRLPFADARMLEFLQALPSAVMYHDHRLKPLLRHAMRGIVPQQLLDRRDKGDYTAAIQRGALPNDSVWERLEGMRRLIDFGLMSRTQAVNTLARLRARSDISWTADAVATDLLAADTWLRLFCENPL